MINNLAGAVMISPPEGVSACSGDQLELTCTTSGSLLEWTFAVAPDTTAARMYTKGLTKATEAPEPLIVNSTRFTFSRQSPLNRLPLVSFLAINPVTVGLNGTKVNCTDVESSETVSITITTITVTKALIEGIRKLHNNSIDVHCCMNFESADSDGAYLH